MSSLTNAFDIAYLLNDEGAAGDTAAAPFVVLCEWVAPRNPTFSV
jgi:hypothetical protein